MINFFNGFRKLSVMLIIITIASIFRINDLVNGAEFVKLISAVGVSFMGVNGLEHMMKTVQVWIAEKKDNG